MRVALLDRLIELGVKNVRTTPNATVREVFGPV
jgi:hypothetical protein